MRVPREPWRSRRGRAGAAARPGGDVAFSVPFVHRLRFTRDALAPDNPVLADVLRPDGRERAACLFVVDGGVAEARPDLGARLEAYAGAHAGTMALAGPAVAVAGGEACKNDPGAVEALLDAIRRARLCRRSYVVAIGGGAVLDVAGFAAAIAHRGVRLVRLPTTTLAQDDSGVGVKCGVNRYGQKNYLGAFAVPWAVINDWQFLETLSDRDWSAGFSEAVKVACVRDAALFEQIAGAAPRLRRRDPAAAEPIIRRSAELHLRHIVERGDPFETTEARPLDFGHWAAHKLEQITEFRLRHGEAVSIGIALDNAYAALAGLLDPAEAARVEECLAALGLPLRDEALADADRLLEGLEEFREHLGGRLTITLLRGIGRPVDVHEVDATLMRRAVERLRER